MQKLVYVSVLGLALAAGCGDDKKGGTTGAGGMAGPTIKIGSVHTLTGEYADYGPPADNAVKLAVKEINDAGGVLGGRKLEVIYTDSKSDATGATAPAMDLITNKKVTAITEDNSSSISTEILKYSTSANVAQISASSTSPSLTKAGDNFFRLAPADTLQAKVLAKQAKDGGLMKVAVLYEMDDVYGMGLNDAFKTSFEAAGGMVSLSMAFDPSAASFRMPVQALFTAAPDGILLVTTTETAAKVLQEFKSQLGPRTAPRFLLPDALKSQDFVANLAAAKSLVEGCIGTAPTTPSDAEDVARGALFTAAYKAAYGKDPVIYNDASYDSIYIIAAAIEKAKSDAPADVLAQIANVAGKQPMATGATFGPGQWAAMQAAIVAGMDVNYQGASGTCDLDENGDPSGFYNVWTVMGGMVKDGMTVKP